MKALTITIAGLFVCGFLASQELKPDVIAAAGDYFKNSTSGVSISWTLGEIATETLAPNGSSVILTQGFQQPNYGPTWVPAIKDFDFEIKVYPNPTTDYIKIELRDNLEIEMNVDMYDAIGRKLIATKMESGVTEKTIDVLNLRAGIYFLKLTSTDQQSMRTYQITKIK
jgi:hypothetical protein